ncbi:DUF2235 domain-containing protein [Sulfitobacter sabulilitoris]|uniref:DUF2235 domain-containing protein n=1 Tax=Sulfitobacter sabulilitoris TaxID=2562655 RepID=A0A5S3PIQ3_9RHOB|nr:DUF2235 domain-containing protein [Sulfitobacter sabulilitoris]TMM54258.1 DUF2235 domain-containing protein [Sulfitobacter sabulilitoris]
MAVIAIFCDGTWNSPTIPQPTHVYRLYAATAQHDGQSALYLPGVGTGGAVRGFLGKLIHKIGGGAFGWGLNDNIKLAYMALATAYQPGDKILIFGFSRGAYTARSLAGMIRKAGILADPTPANLRRAFRLYRRAGPGNAPDAGHIRKARKKLSPGYATSQQDVEERLRENPEDDSHLVRITYLGIWDTVGSLGIPETLLGPIAAIWNARYTFHDTNLSHLVEAARHAVALDERRVFYAPALWDNLEASRDGPGLNAGDRGPTRPYQQVWFVGDHGIAGGSGAARGLSAITLDWVHDGAREAGLTLAPGARLLDADIDPLAPAPEIDDPSLFYRVAHGLLRWRDGPGHDIDLHPTARARTQADASYRPGSLRNLMRDLFT